MQAPADPDIGYAGMSRWQELQQSVAILLEAHQICGIPCDIYFLNRGVHRNIHSFQQIEKVFNNPPYGATNSKTFFCLFFVEFLLIVFTFNLVVNALIQMQKGNCIIEYY